MAYQHQYFSINTDSRKVFDENNKELKLTGNAYRVLVFLCEKQSATLSEISDHLDFAKEYTENHIRQYRHKINTIIGHDVVVYQNSIYSLVGQVQVVNKLPKNDRNTDLLQGDSVELKKDGSLMVEVSKVEFFKFPAIVAVIALVSTIFPWPYGYYNIVKFIVTGAAIYYAYYIYTTIKKFDFWFWALVAIAILFNPITPIYLYSKMLWLVVDVLVIVVFTKVALMLNRRND